MIKVYDFFAGCGGTSSGLSMAGMQVVAGLDSDRSASSTYVKNIKPDIFIEDDIRRLSEDVLPLGEIRDGPVLFCGCAPCQPFSRQNRSSISNDPRRTLLDEFSRFVQRWMPDYILVENVPGLQRISDDEGPFAAFVVLLRKLGYFYETGVLPALWFGVPQTRERLILLASKKPGLNLPRPTHGHGRIPPSTVREWIGHLPPLAAGATDPDDPDHQAAALSTLNLARISSTPEGGGREAWPAELWLACHKVHKGHTDVYGRLSWDRPASGLTTRCISYSNGRFGHPEQHRAISLREAANLQTFPSEYRFVGSLESRARQVGNAVPPLMAQRIGDCIVAHARQAGA